MVTNADKAVKLNFCRLNRQHQRCYYIDRREAYEMLESILATDYDGPDAEALA
jgi:hypothetical protein